MCASSSSRATWASARPSTRRLRQSRSPYLATLNDDAVAHPGWLEALVTAIEARPGRGHVRLAGAPLRRRRAGFRRHAGVRGRQQQTARPRRARRSSFPVPKRCSSPAARRRSTGAPCSTSIGGFDEDFFLYCEDTDLGLRARWAGWKCLYVPEAVVEHHYSHSAGRASPLKAYYVERNRLFVLAKNFPARMLAGGAVRVAGALCLALAGCCCAGAARRPVFAPEGALGLAHALVRAAGARRAAVDARRPVARAPRDPPHARASPRRSSATCCARIRSRARRVAEL